MKTFLLVIWLITSAALAVYYFLKQRADKAAAAAQQQAEAARQESQREIARARDEAQAAMTRAQWILREKLAELAAESERVREHYEKEALRVYQEKKQQLEAALAELAPLRGYASLKDVESEVTKTLAEAIAEATALRREAQLLVDQTNEASAQRRLASQQQAREIRAQADALLIQATRDAGRIVEAAERRAEKVGGDAYVALRDKQVLEQAVGALWNVVEGYGDRYVIPTHSLLDDLATGFSHTKAGDELKAARDQTRRLVELKLAAACNYEEPERRDRANRFVVDAFNGRVDAILSRTKHDNYGTLEQEIRDAFSVVNLNGLTFRDARILPAYLEARLAELKWAVVVQEIRLKAREMLRAKQEEERENEKVRREAERAIQELQKEEDMLHRAREAVKIEMDDTIQEQKVRLETASGEQRAQLEQEYQEKLGRLNLELQQKDEKLREAEEKEREISNAQLTRAGTVYIISNIGSFGEEVFKIGMTRRRDPMDRIWELGGASVPFDFDVHAMINTEDAPALEQLLHKAFDDLRINKVNYRKEFFRLPLERIRAFAT